MLNYPRDINKALFSFSSNNTETVLSLALTVYIF